MKNKMADLRNHLFATLESLNDPDKPMEIQRAKAVCDVAQTIINTAKVEIDLIEALGTDKHHLEFFGERALKEPETEKTPVRQLAKVAGR